MISIFGDLSIAVSRLTTEARDYRGALDLLLREGDRFPEEDWHITDWKVETAALCQEYDLALGILRDGIERGLWYPAAHFASPEFAGLQGYPQFSQLVAACAAREQAAAHTEPALFTFAPDGVEPASTLIAIHRNHSSVDTDHANWLSSVERGWQLIMPQSSQVMGPAIHVWNDREKAVAEIVAQYERLQLTNMPVICGGLMSGADVALRVAFSGRTAARGVIAISPVTPTTDHLAPLVEQARERGLRVYVFVGERDRRCYEGASQLAVYLQAHDIETRFHVRLDYTFGYPPDFPSILDEAIAFVWSGDSGATS